MSDETDNQASPFRPRLAVCYGTSLFLRGVAVELARLRATHLVQVRATRPDARQTLRHLRPDLIVVDLVVLEADAVLDLLHEYCTTPVVGLDVLNNTGLLDNSSPLQATTAQELLHSIQGFSNEQR
jgi:chemotaxis response regulator CheB